MSGGEPSSIKRDVPCAARTPVPCLQTEDVFIRSGHPLGAARVPFLSADSIFQEVCSMYQALYRKWRPKVFSDVIGQEHITETLKKQIGRAHV